MARPAGRKLALVMSVAFVVGLVGARAEYVAAASSTPRVEATRAIQAVADSSSVSVGNLYNDLHAPTDPTDWCSIGGPSTPAAVQPGYGLGISQYCPQLTPSDDYHVATWSGSNTTSCVGDQGPADDAASDPSGIALSCSNGEQGAIIMDDSGLPTSQNWTLWADLTGASGAIETSGEWWLTWGLTGSAPNQTLSVTLGPFTVALDPIPAFTEDTSWAEITETWNPATNTECLDVDSQQSCVAGDGGIGLPKLNFEDSNPTPAAPDAYWGYGFWPSSDGVLVSPPPWSDFGSLGCPGLSTGCSPVANNGIQVVPASCSDSGTVAIAGTQMCTWDNLSAYWFAMIGSI